MKIIEEQKRIDYFGVTLVIPLGYKAAVATNSDGSVNYFIGADIECGDEEWSHVWIDDSESVYLCEVDLEGLDWRESKVVIND